jgi:hypothetical protein
MITKSILRKGIRRKYLKYKLKFLKNVQFMENSHLQSLLRLSALTVGATLVLSKKGSYVPTLVEHLKKKQSSRKQLGYSDSEKVKTNLVSLATLIY